MGRAGPIERSAGARFVLALGLAGTLAGCAALGPGPAEESGPATGSASPAASPATPETGPSRAPASARGDRPAAANLPGVSPPPAPALDVPILYSASAPAQADIAARIADALDGGTYTARRIDVDSIDDAAESRDAPIVAAIGPAALDVAGRHFAKADIVFGQVLEPDQSTGGGSRHGIAPAPPASLQFAAWAEIDPGLGRVGLIASSDFAGRVPDAAAAAAAIGAELVPLVSTSDRETLYLFRRLAPSIDGLWLAPDSAILSPAVIDEILNLAGELDVGVLVFNETLLERGGLIHVGAPPEHIADQVVAAIEQIRLGYSAALPTDTPLREGRVRVNAAVASALGLPPPARTDWVIRE